MRKVILALGSILLFLVGILTGLLIPTAEKINHSAVYFPTLYINITSPTYFPTVTATPSSTPESIIAVVIPDTQVYQYVVPQPTQVYQQVFLQQPIIEQVTTPTAESIITLTSTSVSSASTICDIYISYNCEEWHPWIEPTLANVINMDALNLDEEIDRVYYGLVGTRTPTP
jgi:hypothetical protein